MRTVMILLVLVGCSPSGHRAYQNTMAVGGSAMWIAAAWQTDRALSDPGGRTSETNPTLGVHPSSTMLVGATVLNLGLIVAVRLLPEDKVPPWAKSVLLSTIATAATIDAYNDYVIPR